MDILELQRKREAEKNFKAILSLAFADFQKQWKVTLKESLETLTSQFEKKLEEMKKVPVDEPKIEIPTAEQIAGALMNNPEFMAKTKGQPGQTVVNKEVIVKEISKIPQVKLPDFKAMVDSAVTEWMLQNPQKEISLPDFETMIKNLAVFPGPADLAEPIARAIEGLPLKDKLDYEAGLKNKPSPKRLKKQILRGGSGETSSGLTKETPVGALYDQNTTLGGLIFTVSAEPEYVVADGATFFDGAGYTYTVGSITMDTPVTQYIRSFHA